MRHLLASLALCASAAVHGASVTCAGQDDTADVQEAVNAGGVVKLLGATCALTATLTMTTSHTGILSEADITSSADPIVLMQGFRLSLQGYGRRIALWGPGVGIEVVSGGDFTLASLNINSSGHGIWLRTGAGAKLRDLHFNGQQWMNTQAIRVDGFWDTLRARDVHSEGHDHGIRFGGGVFNVQLSGITLDSLRHSYGIGLWIEADTANIGNIQSVNLWMGAGYCPIAIVAHDGRVINHVQLENTYATNFYLVEICTYGTITGFQQGSNLILAP